MNCESFRSLILDYTNDDAGLPEIHELKGHLGVCKECSKFLRLANSQWKLMDEWEEIEPREGYIASFWEMVDDREGEGPKPWFLDFIKNRVPNWSYIPALSVVVIIFVAMLYMRSEPGVVEYTKNDREDENLLFEVDRTISFDDVDMLEIYGPWEVQKNDNKGG